jgi:hypothetical protein
MRIWRGGSLGSGPVGGGRGQAARWRARSGSAGRRVGGQVCEHPVAVAGGGLRGRDAGGGDGGWAAVCTGTGGAGPAVAADAGGGGRRWAGSAARFDCEWAGRARE